MGERVVATNGIEVWTEAFGDPGDPAVLLIMGASAQGILWPDELCEGLAANGRHVIRYDNRDTGQSTCVDFAAHPYAIADLAKDAVGILDAYGIDAAHLVGASLGGMIAQTVCLERPDRVLTLTSVMSSPLGQSIVLGMHDSPGGLPGPEPKVVEAMLVRLSAPADEDARLDSAVVLWRALSGTLADVDEAAIRDRERRVLARARNIDAAANHQLAVACSPDRTEALRTIGVPTLVVHGTADPILPLAHGEATAAAIPGAALLRIEGLGHEIPSVAVPILVAAITRHTA